MRNFVESQPHYRPTNAKERWLGAMGGALVTTVAALITNLTSDPLHIAHMPFPNQLLLYTIAAGGGALLGGIITSDGKVIARPKITQSLR